MDLKNISENSINKVVRKGRAKRGIATVLSLLSIIGGYLPLVGATDEAKKQAEKQSNIQKSGNGISSLSDIRFGIECLAIGAIFMKIYDNSISSNKERLFTPEGEAVYKSIENLRDYVSKDLSEQQSLMPLFDRLYGLDTPCDDTYLVNLVIEICNNLNKLIGRLNSEFKKEFKFIDDYNVESKNFLNKYNCPFSFLSAIRFEISYILKYIPEVAAMNKHSALHDLLILYNLFVKIDNIEFYKTQNQ